MQPDRFLLIRRGAAALAAGAALLLLSACAGSGGAAPSAGATGSRVEVFGVIDAGVSHTTSRSEPAR